MTPKLAGLPHPGIPTSAPPAAWTWGSKRAGGPARPHLFNPLTGAAGHQD
jgi:hypothetical protein